MQLKLGLLSLLAASCWAAPGSKCKPGSCNADDCLRAVRASNHAPGPSSATADCSSFLRTTVTPCVLTTTTTTVTRTAAPTTVQINATIPVTNVVSLTQTVTSVVTTIEDTATVSRTVPVVETQVTVIPITTVVTTIRPAKRAVLPALPTFPSRQVQRRVVVLTTGSTSAPPTTTGSPSLGGNSTCPATTRSPSAVPTYASACSGTVRYSSACSCAGVTAATITANATVSTVTATSTSTVYPTALNTNNITRVATVTQIQTKVVPSTFETTDATLIVDVPYTTTQVVPVTTTIVTTCNSYKFAVVGGTYNGQFLTGPGPDNTGSYAFLTFTTLATNAISFTIRSGSGIVYSSNVDRWITRGNQLYYILQSPDASANIYNIDNVSCSITSGGSGLPTGAVGLLSCMAAGHATTLRTCPNTGGNLAQGTDSEVSGYNCATLQLAAIPSC